jgi:hypothetical protein
MSPDPLWEELELRRQLDINRRVGALDDVDASPKYRIDERDLSAYIAARRTLPGEGH